MGMIRNLLLAALLLGCFPLTMVGQEVRTVDGDKYIVHTVEQGETLFGLSRHYAVPLDAITASNPGTAEGLSIGQTLLIPVKAQSRRELKSAPELGDGELLHTVTKKETIYGIARKYGVTQEDLRRLNPDLSYGLRVGMVLRVQLATSTAAPPIAVQPAMMDSAEFHQVAPGETLYSLGKQYGISPDAIKESNGGLPEGLKAGTYIRIPHAGQRMEVDSLAMPDTTPRPSLAIRRRVAVLLPFTSTASDSVSTGDEEYRSNSITDAAVEFRAGLAMAMDTLQTKGLNADLYVFDTGMKAAQWTPLFKSDAIRGMDLYIGPFHRAAIEDLVKVASNAPIICPVPQSNKVILGNRTVSKALGGRTDRLKLMARYVAFNHGSANILLLKPEIYSEKDVQDLMERELDQVLRPKSALQEDSLFMKDPSNIKKPMSVVTCDRRDVGAAISKLETGRPNILVVPSEDVEFVTTVLNKFSGLVSKYAITVYGLNSWTTMSTLDISALVKLKVRLPANGYIDYHSPAVNDFIAAYRARFQNEPGEYAFLGYDVALYFLQAEMQFGNSFPKHYAEVQAKPLYLDFRMQKLGPENGWSNSSAVMLEYRPEGLFKAK